MLTTYASFSFLPISRFFAHGWRNKESGPVVPMPELYKKFDWMIQYWGDDAKILGDEPIVEFYNNISDPETVWVRPQKRDLDILRDKLSTLLPRGKNRILV